MKIVNRKSFQGFTLIELLIVIAVLGVLAAVVLVAINPLEQLARGRDAGRKNTAGQLHNAVLAFYTARNGVLPAETSWITGLQTAGEVQTIPAAIAYSVVGTATCATNVQPAGGGWCYNHNGTGDANGLAVGATDAIVYVRLESNIEKGKCSGATPNAFFLWHAAESQAGVVCAAGTDPAIAATYTFLP